MPLALYMVNYISMLLVSHVPNFLNYFIKFLVVIMPTIGYADTLRLMIKTKSPAAFNMEVVLVITSSHALRILYWVYHRFANHIFGQSIALLIVHFSLAFFKYHYQEESKDKSTLQLHSKAAKIKDFTIPKIKRCGHIWNIYNAQSFVEFSISFFTYSVIVFVIFQISRLVIPTEQTVEFIGLISNLVESLVSIPVFIKVVCKRDIVNISTVLIFQYLFGDMFKIILYWLADSPWPFYVGAFIQLSLDIVLFTFFMQLSYCVKHEDEEEMIKNDDENLLTEELDDDDKSYESS